MGLSNLIVQSKETGVTIDYDFGTVRDDMNADENCFSPHAQDGLYSKCGTVDQSWVVPVNVDQNAVISGASTVITFENIVVGAW